MKTQEAIELLEPFIEKCRSDDDEYFLIHVSKVDDHAKIAANIAPASALVIIDHLVHHFQLDPVAVLASLSNK